MDDPILIEAARIFDSDVMRGPGVVEIALGRITAIHDSSRGPTGLPRHRLPAEAVLAPGLIDLQVNGGGGVLLNDAAGVETIRRIAAAHGITGVTRLFNAMSQMTPRAPGIVGKTLADERLFAGLICDGLHVDPINLQVAFRAKGRDRLMLVSDAMPSIGSDSSSFMLQGLRIALADGRQSDARGTLAGANLGMIDAVWNAVIMMDATLEDALIIASRTPARFLGLEAQHGRIAPGYRADLVAFTERDVLRTWIGGSP